MERRFEGKVAFITGASNGMGRAIAERLCAEGATVVGADIDEQGLAAVEQAIAADGGSFGAAVVDITDPEACRTAIADAVAAHGRLDILGNVAGIARGEHFEQVTEARYRQMMGVNIDGAFFLSQAAMPHLLETDGNLVNIASNAGLQGLAFMVPYCVSKGAIVQLTRALALEYAKTGVRINAIAPAGTTTKLTETFEMPEDIDVELASRTLGFRGMNEPHEIAALFAFIVSGECSGIHGAIITADRGVTTG